LIALAVAYLRRKILARTVKPNRWAHFAGLLSRIMLFS